MRHIANSFISFLSLSVRGRFLEEEKGGEVLTASMVFKVDGKRVQITSFFCALC